MRFYRKLGAYISGILVGIVILIIFNKIKSQYKDADKTGKILMEIKQKPLQYTKHAACRMQCREITTEEVQYVLNGGIINYSKSNTANKPCPTYALEGVTKDHQEVRIIFALCDTETRVVTVIDLRNNHADCNCD